MEDVRLGFRDHRIETPVRRPHLAELANHRQLLRGHRRLGGSMECPAVDLIRGAAEPVLFRRRHLHGFPAALALRRKDPDRAEGVAALKGQRMVKKVQNFHSQLSVDHTRRPSPHALPANALIVDTRQFFQSGNPL